MSSLRNWSAIVLFFICLIACSSSLLAQVASSVTADTTSKLNFTATVTSGEFETEVVAIVTYIYNLYTPLSVIICTIYGIFLGIDSILGQLDGMRIVSYFVGCAVILGANSIAGLIGLPLTFGS